MYKFALILISSFTLLIFVFQEKTYDKTVEPDFIPTVTNVIEFKPVQRASVTSPIISSTQSQLPKTFLLNVPFTSQAPHKNWNMPYQEACEEAAIAIVDAYLKNETFTDDSADKKILDILAWETANHFPMDIDIKEAAKVANGRYGLKAKAYYDQNISIENIKKMLVAGHPIIIPAAGRKLGNPHFTPPGPEYHMLVIIGYSENNFITNDPGTRFGQSFEYPQQVLIDAIHDWNGAKETIEQGRKAMLILSN